MTRMNRGCIAPLCTLSSGLRSGSLALSGASGADPVITPAKRYILGCHHSRPLKRPSAALQRSRAVDILKTFKIIPEMSSVFSKITSSKGKRGRQPLLERAGDAEGSCCEGEGGIAQECNHAFGVEDLS